MKSKMTRREFVKASAAASVVTGASPTLLVQSGVRPLVISAANGNFYKNGGTKTCVETAFERITAGANVLEALIAGVNIVELDPEETSVGYGGLPNAEGVVQLDSCCMDGPTKRAGGVAAIEGVRNPSRVAYEVMQQTDHHLLVGAGATAFARRLGFTIEDDLNTPTSRKAWLEWKRRIDPEHYLDPAKREIASRRIHRELVAEGILKSLHAHGTINCDGINARGEIAGVTTTSGLAWKIPGRVGDSPILGAGLYVDGEIGAAGSTGRGEANLFGLCSFLIVENMRRGMHPKDAGMDALRRVTANTVEKRLQKPNGEPNFNLTFYVLNARGEHAGVALYGVDEGERGWAGENPEGYARYALCTENGPETRRVDALLEGTPGT